MIDVEVVKPPVVGEIHVITGAARSIVTADDVELVTVPRLPAASDTEFNFNRSVRIPSEQPVTESVITLPVSELGVKTQPTALAEVVFALTKSLEVKPEMLSLNVNV